MPFDNIDDIMDEMASKPRNIMRIPVSLQGVPLGEVQKANVQFIIRGVDERGSIIELLNFDLTDNTHQGGGTNILPSPS